MNDRGNIFDFASGDFDKKKKKRNKKQEKPAAPEEKPGSEISDADVKEMFKKAWGYVDEISKKLDEAYAKTNISPKDVENYLNNPNNFSPKEWERIQNQRDRLLSDIDVKTSVKFKKKKKKSRSNLAHKKLKGKALGKRKGWMSM